MGIAKAMTRQGEVKTVLGVDASTNSFAFCLFEDGRPVRWGELNFDGATVFERLAFAQRNITAMKEQLKADLVVFESAIFVQNKKTVILLAYSFGAVISALINNGARVEEMSPLTWQNAIGNKPLSKSEKQDIVNKFPGKSKTWYQAKNREFRKKRTMEWVKSTYGISVQSDNVSDAIALASVAYEKFSESA